MKLPVLGLAAAAGLVLTCDSTYAQAAPPSSPPPPAAASGAPAATTPDAAAPEDEKGKMKEIRQACREQVKGQGLKGDERMKAISACVVKQRPELAKREGCRMTGFEKGLRKEELHSFVKDCVKSKA